MLAPSCRVCVEGALTLRDELLDNPELAIEVELIWIEILPADVRGRPDRRLSLFAGDERVHHFYDGCQRAGRLLAERLHWPLEGPIFDAYLYFESGAEWTDVPPEPAVWFHQQLEAGGPRLRSGEELAAAFRDLARRASTAAPGEPGEAPQGTPEQQRTG